MDLDGRQWMERAVALAVENVRSGRGGPFGALVVKQGQVIAAGANCVTCDNDPTAHAEVVAIREACRVLGHFQLDDCDIYSSCEPCPMCLGAIYWARPRAFYFATTRVEAASAGFDDAVIYQELALVPERRSIPGYVLAVSGREQPFVEWARREKKILY